METENSSLWNLIESASTQINDDTWKENYRKALINPVNRSLSDSAKALLSKLYSLQGKTILTGQHDYLEAPNWLSGELWNKTGTSPYIKGVEFGGILNQDAATLSKQRQNVVNVCIDWKNKGGIVSASYHASFPGKSQDWVNVKQYTLQNDFDLIVTPGTTLYNSLISDIDKVAVHLKQLRDANTPVLWRPYHEMNGSWFWWGAKNNFSKLWDIMYDRYVNYHNLNNLIWVWCPNANNQWCNNASDYYVGHSRADVLAMDIYNNDFKQSHYDELLRIGSDKLIAIGENGELPNLTAISLNQNKYSWFMTWGKMLLENNSDATIKSAYNNTYALKRGQEYQEYIEEVKVADGLLGQYYQGTAFDVLKITKVMPKIEFIWSNGTPVGGNNFSVCWSGFVAAKYSEEYTFHTISTDGVRLYINDVLVVDNWVNPSSAECSGKVKLIANRYNKIRLEYFNTKPVANVKLFWSSLNQPKEIVPQSQLSSK